MSELRATFGFGVAGNFAGHLEQAGEAADFVGIGSAEVEAPKGIFPWFVPDAAGNADADGAGDQAQASDGSAADAAGTPLPGEADWAPGADGVPSFLRTFPITRGELRRPAGDDVNLQIEPEVGLLAKVTYDESGTAVALTPQAVGAFNDCSIRRAGAQKISHKKNWGPATKGLAETLLPIDDLSPDGPTAGFRLACFLVRDGQTHAYGVDSAVPEYSYYGDTLLDWIVDRLANQTGAPDSPLEPV
ncbi:MAG: DUF5718 family protein, partial [Solirubrobacteraceae bacterium]|nr:DUF5718 family protein [Solirubrobacteraceae bacterium]